MEMKEILGFMSSDNPPNAKDIYSFTKTLLENQPRIFKQSNVLNEIANFLGSCSVEHFLVYTCTVNKFRSQNETGLQYMVGLHFLLSKRIIYDDRWNLSSSFSFQNDSIIYEIQKIVNSGEIEKINRIVSISGGKGIVCV